MVCKKSEAGIEQIWRELGEEIKILCRIMQSIRCKQKYQGILRQADFKKFDQAIDRIIGFKDVCEGRMMDKTNICDTDVFDI